MKYFSTLLPPPNLTGILHLGHMWNAILQDLLIRYYKSQGIPTYWGYGVDHAGLSLQIKVEEELKKQGIDPKSLSEEELDKYLWDWANKHREIIRNQYKQLNLSISFEEERFTMDEDSKNYVFEFINKLYDEGYIYKGRRLVDWDPILNNPLLGSDIEYRPVPSKLYYLKYFLEGQENKPLEEREYIEIATSRPETIFWDYCIFINPNSPEAKKLINKNVRVIIPLDDTPIPVHWSLGINKDFGSGAMKCTPTHDKFDLDLIDGFGLDVEKIFDLNFFRSRKHYEKKIDEEFKQEVLNDLDEKGFLIKEKTCDYISYRPFSLKTGVPVENIISDQFFLDSKKISSELIYFSDMEDDFSSLVNVYPRDSVEKLKKILEKMREWCISRQVKWGIKIPNFKNKEKEIITKDVLDTWFSSSLWPLIVVLEKHKDFFPLSVLITGKDILLPWVSKMMFMSFWKEKRVPFKNIFLHGLVLDEKGNKMSKSKGNGIDPRELIEEFSLDVVRLFFISNTYFDKNIRFSKKKLDYYSKFLNKLKNVNEFVTLNLSVLCSEDLNPEEIDRLNGNEIWILNSLNKAKKAIKNKLENFFFAEAAAAALDFVWNEFCNKYIEVYKLIKNYEEKRNNPKFFSYIWKEILFLLYPFIPSWSEKSYLNCYKREIWKDKSCEFIYPSKISPFAWFYDYLNLSNKLREICSIPFKEKISVFIYYDNDYQEKYLKTFDFLFSALNQEFSFHPFEELLAREIHKDTFGFKCYLFEPGINIVFSISEKEKISKWFKLEREKLTRDYEDLEKRVEKMKATNTPSEVLKEFEDKLRKSRIKLKKFLC